MAKVFLSSTFIDMEDYRTAAFEAIEQHGHQCTRMETFPAASREIPEFCREKVSECDVFVLILGGLYGTPIPSRNISYTEDEFDAAEELKKDHLVFVPTPKATFKAVVNELMDKQIDIKDQKDRRARFWSKALRGIQPRPFDSPADLKFQMGHSLSQFFNSQQPGPPPKRYSGRILPLLADRTSQLSAFSNAFETVSSGQPQIYILFGHEEEQHHNCVRRLICRNIVYPTRSTGGGMLGPKENGAVISWPDSDESEELALRSLQRQLCEALNPKIPNGISVEAFCRLASHGPATHLVFRHPLIPDEWTMTARSLYTSRYLKFWCDVGKWFAQAPRKKRAPRLIVFFEFKHRFSDQASAKHCEDSLRTFFQANRPDGTSVIFLPPLPRVKFADLNKWYEMYKASLSDPYKTWNASRLFPADSWTMMEVERILHRYLGLEAYAD